MGSKNTEKEGVVSWIAEVVEISQHGAGEGDLFVMERSQQIPFDPRRTYFISGVPSGARRGHHAHKELRQVMVAAVGSLVVTIDDGATRKDFLLDNPTKGLLIREGAWREMSAFSQGAICIVVVSRSYDESDYIRNYEDFLTWRKNL